MGSTKANIFVPFQITYIYDAADEWGDDPWNVTTKNCNETYDVSARKINFWSFRFLFILKFKNLTFFFHFYQNSSMPCSCVDCPIACPFMKLEIESNTFMIGEFNGYGVIAAIVVVLVTIVASGTYTLHKTCKKGMTNKKINL